MNEVAQGMSLKEELDALRRSQEGVDDLVYADLTSQMVLYASSGDARAQEAYDRLVTRAGALLAAKGPAARMGAAIGIAPGDGLTLESDGTGVHLYVRAGTNADECLIFGCRPGADVSAIATAAAETLTRFASPEE